MLKWSYALLITLSIIMFNSSFAFPNELQSKLVSNENPVIIPEKLPTNKRN